MNPSQHAARRQRVLECADSTDAYGFFNLLTGPQLLHQVEALLPDHRERVVATDRDPGDVPGPRAVGRRQLSPGGQYAAVKRPIAGLTPHRCSTKAYCQARSRLPLSMIESLTRQAGGIVAEGAPLWWFWRNRRMRTNPAGADWSSRRLVPKG